jgi:hypothetical protein
MLPGLEMSYAQDKDKVSGRLVAMHQDVDDEANVLASRHAARLQCARGCSDCCRDGLTVFAVEAERIRRNNAQLLDQGSPHAEGACAFLDGEGACRIYQDRPYVCRTQGLPLRWLDTDPAGAMVEYRDICPLNEEGPPLEQLAEGDCWTLGPTEGRLAALQEEWSEGHMERLALRDLFARCHEKD